MVSVRSGVIGVSSTTLGMDGGCGTKDELKSVFWISRGGVRIRRDLIDFVERLLITECVSSTAAFTSSFTLSNSLLGLELNIEISSFITGCVTLGFGFGSIGESACVINML